MPRGKKLVDKLLKVIHSEIIRISPIIRRIPEARQYFSEHSRHFDETPSSTSSEASPASDANESVTQTLPSDSITPIANGATGATGNTTGINTDAASPTITTSPSSSYARTPPSRQDLESIISQRSLPLVYELIEMVIDSGFEDPLELQAQASMPPPSTTPQRRLGPQSSFSIPSSPRLPTLSTAQTTTSTPVRSEMPELGSNSSQHRNFPQSSGSRSKEIGTIITGLFIPEGSMPHESDAESSTRPKQYLHMLVPGVLTDSPSFPDSSVEGGSFHMAVPVSGSIKPLPSQKGMQPKSKKSSQGSSSASTQHSCSTKVGQSPSAEAGPSGTSSHPKEGVPRVPPAISEAGPSSSSGSTSRSHPSFVDKTPPGYTFSSVPGPDYDDAELVALYGPYPRTQPLSRHGAFYGESHLYTVYPKSSGSGDSSDTTNPPLRRQGAFYGESHFDSLNSRPSGPEARPSGSGSETQPPIHEERAPGSSVTSGSNTTREEGPSTVPQTEQSSLAVSVETPTLDIENGTAATAAGGMDFEMQDIHEERSGGEPSVRVVRMSNPSNSDGSDKGKGKGKSKKRSRDDDEDVSRDKKYSPKRTRTGRSA